MIMFENSVVLTIEPFDYFDVIENFRHTNEIQPEDVKYFSEEMRNEMYANGYVDAIDMETCEAQLFWLAQHKEYLYPRYECSINLYASAYLFQYTREENISTSYKDHFFSFILTKNHFERYNHKPPPELLEHDRVVFQNRCYDPELVIEIIFDVETINHIDFGRFTSVRKLNIVPREIVEIPDEFDEHYRKYIPESMTSVRELYIRNSLRGKISLLPFPNLQRLEYIWDIEDMDDMVIKENGKMYQKTVIMFERELELQFTDIPSSLIEVEVNSPCLNNYQVFDAVPTVDVPRVHGWDMPSYRVFPGYPVIEFDEDGNIINEFYEKGESNSESDSESE